MGQINKLFTTFFIILVPLKAQEKIQTFRGTSLIHMPSTEDLEKGMIDFRFNHRFGNAKSTLDSFFGMDGGANNQLSLDYGITDKWSVGIARTSQYKTYEVRTKVKIFSQNEGFPITVSLFGVVGQETSKKDIYYPYYIQPPPTGISIVDSKLKIELNEYETSLEDRRSYLSSLLISRHFGEIFSLQLSGIYVHRNFVKSSLGNTRLGLSVGSKLKLTKNMDFVLEAIFTPKRDYVGENYRDLDQDSELGLKNMSAEEINSNFTENLPQAYLRNVVLDKKVPYLYTPFSFGIDYETSGHVFQIFITNNRTLAHTQLLRGADFDYQKKDWTLGFNIHRIFD